MLPAAGRPGKGFGASVRNNAYGRFGVLAAMRALLALGILALLLAGCTTPATVGPASTPDPASLLKPFGSILKVGESGNEPVIRVAPDGTIYVAALQYLYVSTDAGATFKPVDFKQNLPIYASDSALSVAPDGHVYVAFDWPYAGQTAVCDSKDKGATWHCAPIVVPGATDRMWIVAPTEKDAYLVTGEQLDRPTFAVTHDAGQTWTITTMDWTEEVQGEDMAWDPVQKLVVEAAGNANGPGWGVRTITPDGKYARFDPMEIRSPDTASLAVDAAGTWWAATCADEKGDCKPALASSLDHGKTWAIHNLTFTGKTILMPYVTASRPGEVAMAWYESNASADDAAAEWHVVVARSVDGSTFHTEAITNKPVHVGPMCRAVTCLGDNRFAGDFLGLAFDAQGSLHATWMRQDRAKDLPSTQLNPSGSWEHVEYARTS
jgi:hypothetical protein